MSSSQVADAPAAPLLPPLKRYLAALKADELPWRPSTRRYRLDGAIHMALLDLNAHVLYSHVLWSKRRPKTLDDLAAVAHMGPRTAAQALADLEKHGWMERAEQGWRLNAGLDCNCPKPPRISRQATPEQVDAAGGRTALYRLYDVHGVLLYVGITDALRDRMGAHAGEKSWWHEVAGRTVAWYDDRDDADLAETLAIAAEKPRHNKAKVYAPKAAVAFDF